MSHALHFVVLMVSGWVNRQQQEVIEYLRAENGILRERLEGGRPGGMLNYYDCMPA